MRRKNGKGERKAGLQNPSKQISLSQFKDKQGYIDQQYFLVDMNDRRTLLPNLDVHDYNEEWTAEKNPNDRRDIFRSFSCRKS